MGGGRDGDRGQGGEGGGGPGVEECKGEGGCRQGCVTVDGMSNINAGSSK